MIVSVSGNVFQLSTSVLETILSPSKARFIVAGLVPAAIIIWLASMTVSTSA